MIDLRGKVVLITGAGGGLGRALVRTFARANARLGLTSRDPERLRASADIARAEGGESAAFACDITRRAEVEALRKNLEDRLGPVAVLVNNAGVAGAASFLEMDDALWEHTFQVNVNGTYNCCKVFLPAMLEARWGRIVNIASTTAKIAYPHVSAYASSKHAVLGLTRALALETARLGITVNAVCPGYLDDELTRENASRMAARTGRTPEEILRLFAASTPQARLIDPEEVAQLALLLASEKAAAVTGQAINVDGGAVMA
ncbi:MAG TPA: SDR family NAD(P)-dependent oxidoreductase [candidate division Zixibacteria bacterium]|nr:SDR family NAD(P)-dependent oxidoreductase [candidate division Zixibacteria bacterium]